MSKTATMPAFSTKRIMIPVNQLQVTFFVRQQLNQDRVTYFADLYNAGAKVPPIKIVRGTNEIQDGRHRKAALEMIDRTEAECEYVESKDHLIIMVDGFKDNLGGALPPTRSDTVAMMKQLLENGATHKRVVEMFSDVYPVSVCRKYLKDAASDLIRIRIQKAVGAVVHGNMTVPKAAEEFSVNPDRLKETLQGNKKKQKTFALTEIKRAMSFRYRSNSVKTTSELRSVLEKYEDGVLNEKQVNELFDHVGHLLKQGTRTLKEWRGRFEAKKK